MTLINRPERTERTALAPDLDALDERAARAWTERMAVRPLAGGRYAVDAQSGATYVVDPARRRCTCPDHRIRGEHCKHLRRVALAITTRRVPPPGKAPARCDACGTETLVDRDAPPPHLCGTCRLDPGELVVDRETGDRLVVEGTTDRRADEWHVDEGTTVAGYPTNDGYPDDDVVVEVVYLRDHGDDDPRTYAFPRSRLRRTDDASVLP